MMMHKMWSLLRSLLRYWFWGLVRDKGLSREQVLFNASEKPRTGTRNVQGIITIRTASSIDVETEGGEIQIDLASVQIRFVPQAHDRVLLVCNCRVDGQLKYLQPTKVLPQGIEHNRKCVVRRVYDKVALLGEHTYVRSADVPSGVRLRPGDVVYADLIDCRIATLTKRAVKLALTQMDDSFGKPQLEPSLSSGACPSISLVGKTHFIAQLHKDIRISLILRNNEKHTLRLKSVTVPRVGEPQLSAPSPWAPIEIPSGGETLLTFPVHPKFAGATAENFEMDFGHFKLRHSVAIVVCETEEEALNAKRRLIAANASKTSARKVMQMHRFIANEVWSRTGDVVPGQCVGVKRRFVSVRLGTFEVPERLRQIYLTTDLQRDMFRAIELHYPIIKEPLSIQTYAEVFGLVLHLEDIENFVLARKYDRDRARFEQRGEYLSLHVDGLAERRPSLVMGDVLHAVNTAADNRNGEHNTIYQGIIHRVLHSHILLKFNPSFHRKYNGEEYRLEFHFSRFNLRKQHHAISKAVARMGGDFLFPAQVTKRPMPQLDVRMVDQHNMYLYDSKLRWFNPSLNPIQKQAVFNILRGEAKNMPYVIFGPPGTGKTMTLVEAILQLANTFPSLKIVVGTPSNSSADMITRRIIQSKVLPKGEFVRLVSFNQIERALIPQDLVSYCATVDICTSGTCPDSMVVTESGLKMRCQWEFIGRYRVTISTNCSLGNFMQSDLPVGHFTHVFIDEAGQCTEPETMVPISLLQNCTGRVVLAGDPRQLQAVVVNRYSNQRGYSKSFLERLLDLPPYKKDLHKFPNTSGYNPMCLTKLLNNYRALPSIMVTYSKLFYDGELIPMVSDTDSREIQVLRRAVQVFQPVEDIPLKQGAFFFGINGENMQDNDSPSWYNPQEAKEIYMTTLALYRFNIEPHQIGILTPYTKQVKTIRMLFTVTKVDAPKIGSVEEFQGQERDIMLISLVRSSQSMDRYEALMALGFVKSSKRMNVAISRARAMMVVFGNPKILVLDNLWRSYITYCAKKNAIFGCKLPD